MSESNATVHELAKAGFGVGTNELYDRARPSYQKEVLIRVLDEVDAKSHINVVEIGSGTGIFTRALLANTEWATALAELKGVEPSEGMRTVFSKTVNDPRVSVSHGTFDKTDIPDAWADIIIIAQAFHWCPDFEGAVKEFARILKPKGVVTLVWNLEDREKAAWVAQLRESYETFEQGSPQFRLGLWRGVFASPSYSSLFQEPIILDREIRFSLPSTLATVEDRVCSKSYIAVLSEDDKGKVRSRIQKIVSKGDDLTWIDESKGVFEFPYTTTVVFMKRK